MQCENESCMKSDSCVIVLPPLLFPPLILRMKLWISLLLSVPAAFA
jgi:hypothetical protein